jgi:hypothetical protein
MRSSSTAGASAGWRWTACRPEHAIAIEEGTVVSQVSFERDIRPLFRDDDAEAMSWAFDLASYEDVKEYAGPIYERLADGSMPCDRPWPEEQVRRFRDWIDAGMPR